MNLNRDFVISFDNVPASKEKCFLHIKMILVFQSFENVKKNILLYFELVNSNLKQNWFIMTPVEVYKSIKATKLVMKVLKAFGFKKRSKAILRKLKK